MYTVIAILLLFLIAVFSILLLFKSKKSNQELLENGTCPACNSTIQTFKDENTGSTFEVNPIKSNILKSHGCSGTVEVEYTCTKCGLKEIHTIYKQQCF